MASADDSSRRCFAQLLRSYDPEMGGFSGAPKFPQPVNMEFLFALHARGNRADDRNKQALRLVAVDLLVGCGGEKGKSHVLITVFKSNV